MENFMYKLIIFMSLSNDKILKFLLTKCVEKNMVTYNPLYLGILSLIERYLRYKSKTIVISYFTIGSQSIYSHKPHIFPRPILERRPAPPVIRVGASKFLYDKKGNVILNFITSREKKHPYHLVDPSPWPFVEALSVFLLLVGNAMYMHFYNKGGLFASLGLLLVVSTAIIWWRDVVREATFEGHHTKAVQTGLKLGFALFIASEVMLFFAFFWGYFHSSLNPTLEIGCTWPPVGIIPMNPWGIPLLNTFILLTSGATITWAHYALVDGYRREVIEGMLFTLLLAVIFTVFQGYEYVNATFSISDGIYGTTFYSCTGLHGLHVIIGTLFIVVCFFRNLSYHFSRTHHIGFEVAIWYWHFVDVVWVFLFLAIYCWGYSYESLSLSPETALSVREKSLMGNYLITTVFLPKLTVVKKLIAKAFLDLCDRAHDFLVLMPVKIINPCTIDLFSEAPGRSAEEFTKLIKILKSDLDNIFNKVAEQWGEARELKGMYLNSDRNSVQCWTVFWDQLNNVCIFVQNLLARMEKFYYTTLVSARGLEDPFSRRALQSWPMDGVSDSSSILLSKIN